MPDLKRYRHRRDPQGTPEPFGVERRAAALPPDAPRVFVVQQHAARRLHWDLRLEIEGVLASWAVPRGPSLDPREKRLAARTEDHPLEYADFEGVIPPGNYGAGAMIVWDRGSYTSADGRSPAEGLAAGKLDLQLRGHKLRGRFALVRLKGEDGKSWLLIRKGARPRAGEPEVVEAQPCSVLSGLTVEQLREGATAGAVVEALLRELRAPRAEDAPDPRRLRPMLAGTAAEPFSRAGWLFEPKYDGARVLAWRRGGEVRLYSRTGRDVSAVYPEISGALAHLPLSDFAIDGEVVALDEAGGASFENLQQRFVHSRSPARAAVESQLIYYAFDCLFALGHDLCGLPLSARKRVLEGFAPRLGVVRYVDHVERDGEALYAVAREHAREGIVAKRADSRYLPGRRSESWLKIKVPRTADLVVVGWSEGRGTRRALGALLLAWHRGDALVYAGSVGSGLSPQQVDALLPRLHALRVRTPAFEGAPRPPPRGWHFTRPELVCEVRYTEITRAGVLRQPVLQRLRDDKRPEDCEAPLGRAAEPVPPPSPARPPRVDGPELSNLDKVFWPEQGYTKGDLLAYYEAIWPWLAPYLRDRPVVLTRYPDGIEGKSFFQKNAPDFTPAWARRESIEGTDYFLCNDLRTLLYVINSGAIPLHVWSARRERLDRPDWLVLDLDPKQAPFAHVVELARHIHGLLESLGAPNFAKTSGQDGLHVLLPLGGALDHDQARTLAEVLGRAVCAERPEIATIARPIAARGDKVYVDYLQNGRGKLIAAPFSVRPRPGAPVSMPLRWSQVGARLDPARWNIRTAPAEMRHRGDPLLPVLETAVDVPALLAALGTRLAG
jgi:bifunctional non-homologous end joining protein LigD